MQVGDKSVRLRIYVSSTDKLEHSLVSEFIVNRAHKYGMAGATVVKGIIGFGASSIIHSYKYWEISDKVPVIIEIIDEEQKVRNFYDTIAEHLKTMRYGCMATLEPVEILLYKSGNPPKG